MLSKMLKIVGFFTLFFPPPKKAVFSIFWKAYSEIPCKKYLVRNVDIAKKKDRNFADITKGICLFLHAAGNKLPVNASFLFDSDACIAKIN